MKDIGKLGMTYESHGPPEAVKQQEFTIIISTLNLRALTHVRDC